MPMILQTFDGDSRIHPAFAMTDQIRDDSRKVLMASRLVLPESREEESADDPPRKQNIMVRLPAGCTPLQALGSHFYSCCTHSALNCCPRLPHGDRRCRHLRAGHREGRRSFAVSGWFRIFHASCGAVTVSATGSGSHMADPFADRVEHGALVHPGAILFLWAAYELARLCFRQGAKPLGGRGLARRSAQCAGSRYRTDHR